MSWTILVVGLVLLVMAAYISDLGAPPPAEDDRYDPDRNRN